MTASLANPSTPRFVALGFSMVVTLSVLGGIDALALREHASQDLMAAHPSSSLATTQACKANGPTTAC